MAKARVKKQSVIYLNPDIILFEPRYKKLREPEAFAPGGIDFYGRRDAEAVLAAVAAERTPSAVIDALEVLSERFNQPGGIVDKFATSILKLDDLVEDRFDSFMDVLETGVAKTKKKNDERERRIKRLFYRLQYKIMRHKRKSIAVLAAAVCCMFAFTSFLNSMTVYEYSYYGNKLGYAQTKSEVFETIDLISEKINDETSAEVQFDKYDDVTFTKVVATDVPTDSQDEILDNFTYLRTLKGSGTVIMVNGERKVLVESEETANKVLDALKSEYQATGNDTENESADFTEEITMEPIETEVLRLKNFDDALETLTTGGEGGEPLVNVETSEIAVYDEKIAYETTYEDSADIYEGDTQVKIEGVEGQRAVVARVKKLNGEEISREELSARVASEPITEVVLNGTKERPTYEATGIFINPAAGSLSSTFGARWGRLHSGLDIAAPYGTAISASDSGTISFAGSASGYGLLIKIDHGNGIETRYGHCSKLLVRAGDKVLQGDTIGLVGSTGRSTGNHCHFEIRINGNAVDPAPYVNY